MPAARYTQLPNQREDEMEAAFESDDEEREDQATRPMLNNTRSHARSPSTTTPGGYDFEQVYDYDFPPPGSPPRPSSTALPNDIGNSNGLLPSGPIWRPAEGGNLLQRGLRSLFPQQYAALPTTASGSAGPASGRAVGGGLDNDGVFANVVAKPVNPADPVRTADGAHVMPEEAQKDAPPTYAAAQADAVPPYWETTVHAPSTATAGEMIVDGLPTGTLFSFLWNMLISLSFNFVGFLLTYLLHTTHAAKYGSRAGLGVTLLQYGFALRNRDLAGAAPAEEQQWPWEITEPSDPLASEPDPTPTPSIVPTNGTSSSDGQDGAMVPYPQEWIAFFLMTLGWFLLLTSLLGYWRVKRWEHQILQSATPPGGEALERDRAVRQNLQRIFGVQLRSRAPAVAPVEEPDLEAGQGGGEEHLSAEERRLRDDLRAAGLI